MKKIPKVFVKQNKKINNNKEIYYSAKDDGKDIFELQFHTPMGYYVKETCTRDLYQVVRDPNAPEDLIKDANRLRRLFQGSVKIPEGVIVNSEKYQYSSSSKRR